MGSILKHFSFVSETQNEHLTVSKGIYFKNISVDNRMEWKDKNKKVLFIMCFFGQGETVWYLKKYGDSPDKNFVTRQFRLGIWSSLEEKYTTWHKTWIAFK